MRHLQNLQKQKPENLETHSLSRSQKDGEIFDVASYFHVAR